MPVATQVFVFLSRGSPKGTYCFEHSLACKSDENALKDSADDRTEVVSILVPHQDEKHGIFTGFSRQHFTVTDLITVQSFHEENAVTVR